MVICWFMSISLRPIEMISRMKSKAPTSEIRYKSVVIVTENSNHNSITSMSCLKKVIDTVETDCGISFINVVLGSGGKGTQL